MSVRLIKFASLFLLSIAAFYGLRALGLDASLAQLGAMVLLLAALFQLRLAGRSLPRILIFGALLFGTLGVAIIESTDNAATGRILVARLSDDELETKSRIFREQINRRIPTDFDALVIRHSQQLQSPEQARRELDRVGAAAVVWNKGAHLRVELPMYSEQQPVSTWGRASARLSELWPGALQGGRVEKRVGALRLALAVPQIYFSFDPQGESARFLTELSPALAALAGGYATSAKLEPLLREAGSIFGTWRGLSHRAYPYWLLGNRYMQEVGQQSDFDLGALQCAFNAYGEALRFIRRFENDALWTAIQNNLGVLFYARYFLTAEEDLPKKAVLYLSKARAVGETKYRLADGEALKGPSALAKSNLAVLKGEGDNVEQHRKKHKRRVS